jgi:hypothetical protein
MKRNEKQKVQSTCKEQKMILDKGSDHKDPTGKVVEQDHWQAT